jgi:hypothetical protein
LITEPRLHARTPSSFLIASRAVPSNFDAAVAAYLGADYETVVPEQKPTVERHAFAGPEPSGHGARCGPALQRRCVANRIPFRALAGYESAVRPA